MRTASWIALLLVGFATTAWAQGSTGTSTSTGVSSAFNPAISLNALFLGSGFSGLAIPDSVRNDLQRSGAHLQEMELQFTSTIDPYSKADAIITFEDGEFGIEELYVTTNVLPHGIGLRAGKTLVPIGIENPLHTHALPFVQRSLVGTRLFDGLGEFGAEATWLAPTPFFVQARGAFYNGDAPNLFGKARDRDLAYLGGLSALWDLGESTTLALEGDYLTGRNGLGHGAWSRAAAGGLTLKWRPTRQAIYRSLRLTSELIYGEREAEDPAQALLTRGAYGYVQYQFTRRWWLQGRYDWENPAQPGDNPWRTSALLGFVPSEFQALRLQVSQVHLADDEYTEAFVQYNFTIGSHPAHRY